MLRRDQYGYMRIVKRVCGRSIRQISMERWVIGETLLEKYCGRNRTGIPSGGTSNIRFLLPYSPQLIPDYATFSTKL